ncbi:hypothetical protein [Terriglobus saanensis]|nr:hypothetical protein [Terriglobus saanensis]
MAFSLTCAVAMLFWWPHRALGITPNALLANAQQWDALSRTDSPGVLYQEISIRTERQQMRRSIYRDLEGKRFLKRVKLNEGEESLKGELTQAGIDWETPISATSYQAWHDHQPLRADKVVRAGNHLLRLTTTVPGGSVAEQSLTVRDTDFHPVRRTVAFRDLGTVEIAELDFKILPWSAVDAGVFEPLDRSLSLVTTNSVRVPQIPRAPESLSPIQFDEAELGARLILNQLHADAGEQIEIHRVPQGIEVEGIVETDERKRELQTRLSMVPHLTISIQSVTDVKNKEDFRGATELKIASVVDRPSPLETSLQAHGRSLSDLNGLAQQIFNTALTISQECKAIAYLQTQFHPGELRPGLVSATLSELLYSHRERLRAALKHERQLITTAEITPASAPTIGPPNVSSLLGAADKNLSLSKELTQASDPNPRAAEEILADMSISMDNLTAAAREAYGKTKTLGANTPSGKN